MAKVPVGRRAALALLATFLMILVLALGALTPLTPSEANELLEGAKRLLEGRGISAWAIFTNNLFVALVLFVPIVGLLIGGGIIYATGQVFGALGLSAGISPLLLIALSMLMLYGFLEFLAYGVAAAQNGLLVYAIFRRRLMAELKWVAVSLAISALLLALAASLEFYLIRAMS